MKYGLAACIWASISRLVAAAALGSWLGFAICRNLLENMGSSLLVDTAVEEGTRFSFRIELPQA